MQNPDSPILDYSAAALAGAIRCGEVSAQAAVAASLHKMHQVNPELNAFTEIYAEDARQQAIAIDARIQAGDTAGALLGVPVAVKDTTPIAGKLTTLGSYAFRNHVADRDAWVVSALRNAGAIIVGRTTTPEFAHSGFTQSPLYGITRNPWDPTRTAGGSSGGSAVAVATHAVPLATGTDMGGSVRIPAALCGVTGLKPSLGRIPYDELSNTFDNISHIGPLARSCADIALFLDVAQGPAGCDIQSQTATHRYSGNLALDPRELRIALSLDLGYYAIDADVERNTLRAAERLRQAGARVEPVDFTLPADTLAVWDDYWAVFMAAHFGTAYDRCADRLDPAVRALIEQGRAMLAVHYKRLELRRTQLWQALQAVLQDHDALLCPTTAMPAPDCTLIDADISGVDADGRHIGLSMTSPFNLTGQCPALSVPAGSSAGGCPTGVQIVGRRHDDLRVLGIGALLESH